MYCSKCGQEFEESSNFCNECGESIGSKSFVVTGDKTIKKKSGIIKKLIIGIVIVFSMLLLIGIFSGGADNEYITDVKNGSFNSYPEILIGDAFDDFFTSPKWNHFIATDGENVVEFTGGCEFDGKNVKALIQFQVDDIGGFEATYFSMNDVSQNLLMMTGIIEAVMEEYKE